jgi:peroxiredoxin
MNKTTQRSGRLSADDRFPAQNFTTLTGQHAAIPMPGQLVHLQFRRFAGCPVCNLHLRSFAARTEDIAAAGIHEVVVFHSTAAELTKYQADLPFDVIPDPGKDLYRRFGVQSGLRSVAHPGAWRALPSGWWHIIKRAIRGRRGLLPVRPNGGNLGLPADLLIAPDGRVIASRYGKHAYDQWSVDELLAHAKEA